MVKTLFLKEKNSVFYPKLFQNLFCGTIVGGSCISDSDKYLPWKISAQVVKNMES